MDSPIEVDILIIGGGLTGASLMLALSKTPYKVMLIEAQPFSVMTAPHFDARSLALSPSSRRILQSLDVWPLLEKEACAIETIHVSEKGGFGSVHFESEAASKLGYVVELQHINRALHQRLESRHVLAPAKLVALDKEQGIATIEHESKTQQYKAKLIVAADGANSSTRTLCHIAPQVKAYHQQAIVANVGLARPHQHIAYERFTSNGPLALLPMNGLRASMVWTLPPEAANTIMSLHERDFLKQLQQTFGYRLGRFTTAGQRISYPLRQVLMPNQVFDKVVFVGNAAHTLHPVAGQGFNLGLRDVAMLAQCIVQQGLNAAMLSHYASLRAGDQKSMARLTDGLIHIFGSQQKGLILARRAGLALFEQMPFLKETLSHYARGFAGTPPDLVCGIPLIRRN